MTTTEKVIAIVANQLKRDPASIDANFDLVEAGYESLDVIETVFAIEDEWDISIDFNVNTESLSQFKTVNDVVRLVDNALAAKSAA